MRNEKGKLKNSSSGQKAGNNVKTIGLFTYNHSGEIDRRFYGRYLGRQLDKCYVVFYASNYLWAFSANYCGFVLGKVLDFGTGVSVFIVIIIFDLITIYRIHLIKHNTGRSIRQRELKFFMQSCLQFSLFVVKLTNFYFISGSSNFYRILGISDLPEWMSNSVTQLSSK
ncbi:unnamed protein product [Nippostrongylus brasiliensis]|uniref:7TM_GPCR_Srx domain-containing protein n=1 Tax=Nippostrongylus brasiliensis TaxID=27835 RepID=A0A0N4YJU7_NIPBR|nr:unnamed protein product [Nippostrongylus brasiliensis]